MARVRREPDGTWSSRVYLGRDAFGRKVRPYRRFPQAGGREEAQLMADEWERRLKSGGMGASTVLPDVLDEYVALRERTGSAPASVREWRCFAGKVRRLMPRASAVDVTTHDLQGLEARLLRPRDQGGEGLSRNSVICVHNFLRAAFRRVVTEGLRDTNPMDAVEKPRPERHEAVAVDEWDMPRLREVIESGMAGTAAGRRYAVSVAAWLALFAGLRVGECCALRRRDVRPRDCSVRVCGSVTEAGGLRRLGVTKGRRGRTVSVGPEGMEVLRRVMAEQDGVIAGLGPGSPLVTTDGSLMRPSAVSESFARMAHGAGLPASVTFHSLRHTHATWSLARGVPIKVLSMRLGHADVATTLRAYAHALPGSDAAAAEAFREAVERPAGDAPAGVPDGVPDATARDRRQNGPSPQLGASVARPPGAARHV